METPVIYVSEANLNKHKAMYCTWGQGKISKISDRECRASAASCLYNYLVKQGSPREQMEALGYLVDELAIPYLLRSDSANEVTG